MRRVILAGGGHAHLFVLERLARRHPRNVEIMLITASRWQAYSGMLPGWMAGHYNLDDCRIDLEALAASAGVTLVPHAVVAIDADQRYVGLDDDRQFEYELLSLDIGSETDDSALVGLGDRLLRIKPLTKFQQGWQRWLRQDRAGTDGLLCVVGGGAAGVELALAARHGMDQHARPGGVALVAGEKGLLPAFPIRVQRKARTMLRRAGVTLIDEQATGTPQGLLLGNGERLNAGLVIAATGGRAPAWLIHSRLALSDEGFMLVDASHRSRSHADVFAAGDICARTDVRMARSGVHAVHAGPVLADNLLACLDGDPLKAYTPRQHVLCLLASGDRRAIASWGSLGVEGAWVWRWKNWIDRRFINRFAH